MNNANFGKIHNDYKNNKSISEIAEYYGLDFPVVWSILLDGKDDLERFSEFGDESNQQPKMSDYWKFNKGDDRLGWIQEKIAEKVGLSQNRISEIIGKLDIQQIDNLYFEKGKSLDTIGKLFDIDLQTTWSILLDGKDDLERFSEFGDESNQQPKMSDYWKFNKGDDRLGWIQKEIAKKVGMTRERISQIVNNINFDKIYNDYQNNKTISTNYFENFFMGTCDIPIGPNIEGSIGE